MIDRTGPDPKSENRHEFKSERLLIALPRPPDAQLLFDLIGGEHRREICETLLWDGPDEVKEIEQWVDRSRSSSYGDHGFHWVIKDRTGEIAGIERPLGAIGTRPLGVPGRADVGYWLGRPYWGQGIMSEALGRLLGYGFEELDYAKVEAEVFTHNERGRRLVESVGMTREGTIRSAHRKYGEWIDAHIYGVLAEEVLG